MYGIWKTAERRDQFWQDIEEVLSHYPELLVGMDEAYEACEEEHDDNYDPESMKFISGKVLLISCGNMEGYESMVILDPPSQSRFMTGGMIKNAFLRE